MADNFINEEFLLDFNKSLEMIATSQSSLNQKIDGLGNSLENLTSTSKELNTTISDKFNPEELFSGIPNLIDGINSLSNTVKQQGESADKSAKDLFSILNPVGAANTAGALPNLPRFAEGGTMEKTGAAIVGERGPELVLLPENSQVYPLETDSFDRFEGFFANIIPSKIMENMFGSDKVLLGKDEAGNVMVYPDTKEGTDKTFEPYSLTEKIESQIIKEEAILNTPGVSSIRQEESEDVLNLLDSFMQEILPKYDFQPKSKLIEIREAAETAIKGQLATAENLLAQGVEATKPLLEPGGVIAATIETTKNILNKPTTTAPAETTVEKTPGSELAVEKEKLSPPPIPTPQVVAPQPAPPAPTPSVITQEISSGAAQSINFPETFSVTITKYEQGEKQFAELKEMLTSMYSVLNEIKEGESHLNISDSYPIRPTSSVF